jgi:succinate-acetate transporter protein
MATTEAASTRDFTRAQAVSPAPPIAPPVADPAPLGLAGFAMTTFFLSVFNAKLIKGGASLQTAVLPLALFYGGIAQLLAGMWEFRRNNTFGALAFSSFGAFWLAYAGLVRFIVPTVATDTHLYQAVGLFLLGWTIFTAYMTVAAIKTNGAVLAVFVALTVTFLFLTIGEFGKSANWTKVGGWTGIVTAFIAWYASFAGVTNSTFGKTVLPTWPARP